MTFASTRRLAFAIALSASSLAFAGVAKADGVTGTDPVPKGCGCTGNVNAAVPQTPVAAPAASTSVAVQAVLVLLGLA